MKVAIQESNLITVSSAELKGKRLLAVRYASGEWIETVIPLDYLNKKVPFIEYVNTALKMSVIQSDYSGAL